MFNPEISAYRRERLQDLIDEKFEGNKASLGRALGYQDGTYVGFMVRGDRPVTEKTVEQIHALRGCSGWFGFTAPHSDFSDLPTTPVMVKYAHVHGLIQGGDSGFIDSVGVTDQDPEPIAYVAFLRDEQAYAVKVRGSSMEPTIMPGWHVIASPARPAQPPDLCVVYFADDRKALKRLLWQRGGITCLESVHKDHAKMMEPDSNILRMDKVISIVPN